MKILIDIKHPAQLNLFKHLSRELEESGWDVTISYLNRGKLPKIIDREYSGYRRLPIGESRGTKWSIFWNGNVVRTTSFLKLILNEKYDICIAASSIPLAFACYISNTPILQFYDDPERKSVNRINAFFSTKLFFPPIVEVTGKIEVFNCLKEWSYLSPKRFVPNKEILREYGLEENRYLFIREVSNKSFNYMDQEDAIILAFSGEIDSSVKVVLSLEDKSLSLKYPKHWTILEEPVSDIHSLIYFSKLVVSSGDSMAREGSMLGVPSIYCGIREMRANDLLIEEGILNHFPLKSAVEKINDVIRAEFSSVDQTNVRSSLMDKWVDMVDFMKEKINVYKKK